MNVLSYSPLPEAYAVECIEGIELMQSPVLVTASAPGSAPGHGKGRRDLSAEHSIMMRITVGYGDPGAEAVTVLPA